MGATSIVFAGDRVALIVRGKQNAGHAPGKMEQHADCVKSDGSPVGYFGAEPGRANASGGQSGYLSSAVLVGIGGAVYDMNAFNIHRPYYVDASVARAYKALSTVLTVTVSSGEAKKFDEYWASLAKDPGTFSLLGRNCSTRASGAFAHSGILSGGIPGLDTPDNLYQQLVAERADRCASYSGYVGFQMAGNGMSVIVEDP